MTELRDARFKRALEHAPDAALRPDRATRSAIKKVALRAAAMADAKRVTAPFGESAWRRSVRRLVRWWTHPPAHSSAMPWNAALATVVLASLVTVLWYERPVPQAVRDDAPAQGGERSVADSAATAYTPPSPLVSGPTSPAPPAPAARAQTPRSQDVNRPVPPTKHEVIPSEPQAAAVPESLAKAGEALGQATVERRHVPELAAPVVPAATAAAKATPHRSEVRELEPDQDKRRADAAARSVTQQPARQIRVDWNDLSVQRSGSPLVLSSAQASRLVTLLQTVNLRATEARDPEPSAATRLELSRRGERVATIELGDRWLRWTPVGTDPRGTLTGRASVAQWEAIQDELERLGLQAP